MSDEQTKEWTAGFWAGLFAAVAAGFVAFLVFLHLKPKPAKSVRVAAVPPVPESLPRPAEPTRPMGFHATLAKPTTPAPPPPDKPGDKASG